MEVVHLFVRHDDVELVSKAPVCGGVECHVNVVHCEVQRTVLSRLCCYQKWTDYEEKRINVKKNCILLVMSKYHILSKFFEDSQGSSLFLHSS